MNHCPSPKVRVLEAEGGLQAHCLLWGISQFSPFCPHFGSEETEHGEVSDLLQVAPLGGEPSHGLVDPGPEWALAVSHSVSAEVWKEEGGEGGREGGRREGKRKAERGAVGQLWEGQIPSSIIWTTQASKR